MLKVLSLHQPWASLIAWGVKTIETRDSSISWKNYRGQLAIQAASRPVDEGGEALLKRLVDIDYLSQDLARSELPLGSIVCVADMVGVKPTDGYYGYASQANRLCGNWNTGRLAIVLHSIQVLSEPVPCRGYPFLFTASEAIERLVRERLV